MTVSADWSRLFSREGPRLRRFLRRFGPSISPEDIAQDSFAQLCAANPETISSPRAYLFRTARNLALNQARHARVVSIELAPDPEALGAVSPEPSPEDQVIAAEELAHLEQVLGKLPSHQRQALLLFKLEGLSHKEIGERLGVSHRTVERYVSDALAHCHLAFKLRAGKE